MRTPRWWGPEGSRASLSVGGVCARVKVEMGATGVSSAYAISDAAWISVGTHAPAILTDSWKASALILSPRPMS